MKVKKKAVYSAGKTGDKKVVQMVVMKAMKRAEYSAD